MTTGRRNVLAWALWAAFSLFVVYGTTIPFDFGLTAESFRAKVAAIDWIPLRDPEGGLASIPDMVQNVLLFLPFGFLGFWAVGGRRGARFLLVTFGGFCLSLFVELLQLLTVARTTSTTDLVTNGAGAFFGFWAGAIAVEAFRRLVAVPSLRRFVTARTFFLFVAALLVASVGEWEPFDFTLDVSTVASSLRDLLRNPIDLSLPKDELVTTIRFALLALAGGAWLKEVGRSRPGLVAAALAVAAGAALELSQVIVSSRSPSLRDGLVITLGCGLGAALLSAVDRLREARALWAGAMVVGTCLADAMQMLHPFRPSAGWNAINWVPFLPYYERTSFVALSNFVEGALIFLPMGFVLGLLYPRRGLAAAVGTAVALGWSVLVELGQGFVEGRHPDVTDVLGAGVGALLGAWACTRGWPRFASLIEDATGGPGRPVAAPPRPAGAGPQGGAPPWMSA